MNRRCGCDQHIAERSRRFHRSSRFHRSRRCRRNRRRTTGTSTGTSARTTARTSRGSNSGVGQSEHPRSVCTIAQTQWKSLLQRSDRHADPFALTPETRSIRQTPHQRTTAANLVHDHRDDGNQQQRGNRQRDPSRDGEGIQRRCRRVVVDHAQHAAGCDQGEQREHAKRPQPCHAAVPTLFGSILRRNRFVECAHRVIGVTQRLHHATRGRIIHTDHPFGRHGHRRPPRCNAGIRRGCRCVRLRHCLHCRLQNRLCNHTDHGRRGRTGRGPHIRRLRDIGRCGTRPNSRQRSAALGTEPWIICRYTKSTIWAKHRCSPSIQAIGKAYPPPLDNAASTPLRK